MSKKGVVMRLIKKITVIIILLTSAALRAEAADNPQISGFKYKKVLEVTNQSENVISNYQIMLRIGEGKTQTAKDPADLYCDHNMEADFKDIRFTNINDSQNIPYYLESIEGNRPNRIAIVWIKVPQISKDTTIRINFLYGNAKAADLSDPENVFDFFDDFSGRELNSQKWQASQELKGRVGVGDSELKLKAAGILTRAFKLQNGIIEFKAKVSGPCAIQTIVRDKKQGPRYATLNQTVYSSAFPGAEHTIAVGNTVKVNIGNPIAINKIYIYQIIAEGLNLSFKRFDADYKSQAELRFTDIGGLTEGYLGLKGDCALENQGEVDCDWIRVRQFTPEPARAIYIGNE